MGTSSSELIKMVYSLGIQSNFLGVFDKNFPGFLNPSMRACAIVNTGDVMSGGVHWIAFAYEPSTRTFTMFDPFGFSKLELLKKYQFQYDRMLRNTAISGGRCIRLVKSTEAVQCPCSAACGLFCVLFLASFCMYPQSPMSHNPIIDIVQGVPHSKLYTSVGISVTHTNQERLYTWLYMYSLYFRNHVDVIKRNTRINAMNMHYLLVSASFFLTESIILLSNLMLGNNGIFEAMFFAVKTEQRQFNFWIVQTLLRQGFLQSGPHFFS